MNIKNEDFADVYNVMVVNEYEDIRKLINTFDSCFTPSLSDSEINLERLSKKFFEYAKIYAVYDDEQLCNGMIAFYVNDKKEKIAYISLLAVKSEYRRKKIGSLLMQIVEKVAKQSGMQSIKLEVKKENNKAISFYKKNGYVKCQEASKCSIYMSKRL